MIMASEGGLKKINKDENDDDIIANLSWWSPIFTQGHPTAIFGKISVRNTIWDLEFSEHLL